jgi:hypothetical protein
MSVDVQHPGPTSDAWDDLQTVLDIAGVDAVYWLTTVSPAAHGDAHPYPVHGCPGCPPGGVAKDMSAEVSWMEAAR